MKGATISYLIYLLLGAAGLPVFSGYQGGLGKLAGPTGGYLIGFIFMALLCGFIMEKSRVNAVITGLGMVAGTLVAYLFGTVWFVFGYTGGGEMSFAIALAKCVVPFILPDAAKMALALFVGRRLKKAIAK